MNVVWCLVTSDATPRDETFETYRANGIPAEWGRVIWTNGDRGDFPYRVVGSLPGMGGAIGETVEAHPDDQKVFGRFHAVRFAREVLAADLVVVQDDDCVAPLRGLVDRWERGRVVANMPQSRWVDYHDSTMVGWGAVFEPHLAAAAFSRWEAAGHSVTDDRFLRCCDVVFSALTPRTVVDLGFSHAPFAHAPERMHKQPGHKAERDEVLRLARRVRGPHDDDRRFVA